MLIPEEDMPKEIKEGKTGSALCIDLAARMKRELITLSSFECEQKRQGFTDCLTANRSLCNSCWSREFANYWLNK